MSAWQGAGAVGARAKRIAAGLGLLLLAAPQTAAGPPPVDPDSRALARIQDPPVGLPPVPLADGNPPTAAKIRLGRELFLDPRLSHDGTMSCAVCHVPEQGFTQHEVTTPVGIGGESLPRNAPTLLNVAYASPFFHDGREPELDLLPLDVLLNPREMALPSLGAAVEKVASRPEYPHLFEEAFGGPPTAGRIGQALGTYVRSLLSARSPFDRWYFGGDSAAVSPRVKRGFDVFTGEGRCAVCHRIGQGAVLFTDHGFHDTGLGWHHSTERLRGSEPVAVEIAPGRVETTGRESVRSGSDPPGSELGRYRVTGDPADRWRFKTPTLRNVALTAPYMHDGTFSTLRQVVEFYDRGGFPHEGIDPEMRPLGLDEQQIEDLVAFLESLTGDNVDELVRDAKSQRLGPSGDRPR